MGVLLTVPAYFQHLETCVFMVYLVTILHLNFFKRLYLFIFRQRGRKGERARNIHVWLPLARPLLGTWPAAQAYALTENRTSDLLVLNPALNPLSRSSQG